MRESVRAPRAVSNRKTPKIQSKKIESLFRILAKRRFPKKTAPAVRALTGHPESTIYDWMAGKTEAPFSVFVALLSSDPHR